MTSAATTVTPRWPAAGPVAADTPLELDTVAAVLQGGVQRGLLPLDRLDVAHDDPREACEWAQARGEHAFALDTGSHVAIADAVEAALSLRDVAPASAV